MALRFGRISSSSARSSPPHDSGLAGLLKRPWSSNRTYFDWLALMCELALHWRDRRFLAADPLGMETTGPRTTGLALERLSMIQTVMPSMELTCTSPAVPASRFHTAIYGVRLVFKLGVHALATPLPSSLASACGPGDSNRGRILLKPSDGIVPSVFSSNISGNATRHLPSRVQR
jgi:hypothetical protein